MTNAPVSIGKYQIAELVGEGAMGNVYRALDPVINRNVAIKVMSDAIARDGALRDRFMREAQAAGSLQHPHVVTIYDFGEVDGHLYIAMEYVEGIDLETLIEQNTPMPLAQCLDIAIDVLLGLSYAHRRGVVHRDIKPANIRITEDGRAKIMDFGVAHLDSAKMTATGVMIGTPYYMAPEQVTGDRIGPATDIFALGSVLYELVSHRKAFAADSIHNVLFKVVSEEPPPLTSVAPQAPQALDVVLRKAMVKAADGRYQTAQEMANELTAVRATVGSAGVVPSLSLGATIAARTAEQRAAQSRELAAQRRWTKRQVLAIVAGVVVLAGAAWAYAARRPNDSRAEAIMPVSPSPARADTSTPKAVPAGVGAPLSRAPAAPAAPVERAERRRVDSNAPPPSQGAVAPPQAQRKEVVNLVRDSAMKWRARAVDAGVPVTMLASGDTQLAVADRLSRSGNFEGAVAAIRGATALWAQAGRAAQQAAPAPGPVPSPRTPDSTTPRTSPVTSAPVVVPPAIAASPAPRPEPEAPSVTADVTSLLAQYARAIEARDLGDIKALYPQITDTQERGFRDFFENVRTLKATFTLGTLGVDGNSATAPITGAYDYTDRSGKVQHQALAFRAVFRRDGTRWQIASVR
jgi:serine/threonine-protein kinase